MKVRHGIAMLVSLLGVVGAGCNRGDDDGFIDAVPEQAALQLDLTGDSAAEGTTTASAELALDSIGVVQQGLAGGVAPYLDGARNGIKALNEAMRTHLQPIAALIRDQAPTTAPGQVRIWGPVTRGVTDYRFVMKRGLIRNRFGWALQAKAMGAPDADYKVVAAGAITVGTVVRRGVGVVGFDLDQLGALDPTVKARGKILASFAHGPRGTALAYGLKGFSPDPARRQPFDAIFQGVHTVAGKNIARLAYHGNLADSATAAEEFALARLRHVRGVGGRADALATGGDVPAGRVHVVNECWDAGAAQRFVIVRDCPVGGIGQGQCTVVKTEGQLTDCAPGLQTEELPPPVATDPMAESEAPEMVTPPTEMPAGDGA